MPHTPETSSSLQDQLLDIQDEAKKNKVELTPEIREYIRTHLEAVQQKLANREEVTEDDMQFIKDVRLWVSIPDNVRGKFPSIEVMKKSEELEEAAKRRINHEQWFDLLHIAEVSQQDKKWIDKVFKFLDDGRIETKELMLGSKLNLQRLPQKLRVKGNVSIVATSIKTLPNNLIIEGDLNISENLPEQVKIDAERLKKEGKIKGRIYTYLGL